MLFLFFNIYKIRPAKTDKTPRVVIVVGRSFELDESFVRVEVELLPLSSSHPQIDCMSVSVMSPTQLSSSINPAWAPSHIMLHCAPSLNWGYCVAKGSGRGNIASGFVIFPPTPQNSQIGFPEVCAETNGAKNARQRRTINILIIVLEGTCRLESA